MRLIIQYTVIFTAVKIENFIYEKLWYDIVRNEAQVAACIPFFYYSLFYYSLFSSPEPKAHGELIVYQSSRRLCVWLCVWLCVCV